MKCTTSDLEIETIYNRIINGDINLQPDFQRGEVWTDQKRRKLIDSILRGWKIPPIHVVSRDNESGIDEILDGQQRLVAIKEFINNKFTVDGQIEPFEKKIQTYDGKKYKELPIEMQRKIKKYSIIFIRLTEYEPEEPAELFNRLNQPTTLTSAEKRNAFIGEPRNQIKYLTQLFMNLGADKNTIGFSNSRLAFDEIISKFCYTLEIGTLKKKITSNDISNKYRDNKPFSDTCINQTEKVLKQFMNGINFINDYNVILNKATLFSWLIFVNSNLDIEAELLHKYITNFEFTRNYIKGKKRSFSLIMIFDYNELDLKYDYLEILVNTFNQRASMGSTDALSIIYRDIILNIYKDIYLGEKTALISTVDEIYNNGKSMNYVLDQIIKIYNWGDKIK